MSTMQVQVHRCAFCGKEIRPGHGIMYVKNNGTVLWFCSSKCRKSMMELRRNPKRLKWTSRYSGRR